MRSRESTLYFDGNSDRAGMVSSVGPVDNARCNPLGTKKEPLNILVALTSRSFDEDKSSDGRMSDEDSNHRWTKVWRKKSRSKLTTSPRTTRSPVTNVLSPGRGRTVRKAEKLLTTPYRETIEPRRRQSDMLRGEDPLRLKGKSANQETRPRLTFLKMKLILGRSGLP